MLGYIFVKDRVVGLSNWVCKNTERFEACDWLTSPVIGGWANPEKAVTWMSSQVNNLELLALVTSEGGTHQGYFSPHDSNP